MNEENIINQETEEKKDVLETANVFEEKKAESIEKVDEEKEQKSKKMDEIFDTTSSIVLGKVAKIVGRDLTDEEKKTLKESLQAHFLMTSLMMGAMVR